MRNKHPGPFPFRWGAPNTNGNNIEPFSFSLANSIEYWWRLQQITVGVTFTATSDVGGADDQRTFSSTLQAVRYSEILGRDLVSGDELYLNLPGADEAVAQEAARWRAQDTSQSAANWLTPSVSSPHAVEFVTDLIMFDTGSPEIRGTFDPDETPVPPTVHPACNLVTLLEVQDVSSISVPPTCQITNVLPAVRGTDNGSHTLSVFGTTVTFYWDGEPGDYNFRWDSVAYTAMTKSAWFAYADTNGSNPVWNAATGAQILDPTTADVPSPAI